MVDAIATGFRRSHVDVETSRLENAWILFGGGAVVKAWGPEIIELREQLRVRLIEEHPELKAGLLEALSVLAARLSHLGPMTQQVPENLVRISEALNRMQLRESKGET